MSPGGPFVSLRLNVKRSVGTEYKAAPSLRGVLKRESGREQRFETAADGQAIIGLREVNEAMVSVIVNDADGEKFEFPIPLPIRGATEGLVTQIVWPIVGTPK